MASCFFFLLLLMCGVKEVKATTLREVCVNKSFEVTLEALEPIEPHFGPVRGSELIAPLISGKRALEIGGPTPEPINIYGWLAACDNVAQFADAVHGRKDLATEFNPTGDKILGRTIIANADDLAPIADETYDLLYASHILEHMRDPLGAALAWDRVLKPGGALFLIVPWKNTTFDRFRAPHTLEQLAQKFVRRQQNQDALMVDFEQTVRAIDMDMDYGFPPGSSADDLRRRTLETPEGMEMLHWHLFDFHLLTQLFHCLNYNIVAMDLLHPFHQVIVGVKQQQ